MTNLTLTSPYMGERLHDNAELRRYIMEVQNALGVRPVDGVYGPATASRAKEWKRLHGFHRKFVTTSLTTSEAQWLFGKKKQSPIMKLRASRRLNAYNPSVGERGLSTMLAWAQRGLTEDPPGSNKVPFIMAYAARYKAGGYYRWMGVPWCAIATTLSSYPWGSTFAAAAIAGKVNGMYVPTILNTARDGKYGLKIVSYADARPGDLVIFNWDGGVADHIGRLVRKIDAHQVHTVEGNTQPGKAGDQSDGGGVFERIRPTYQIQAYIRES